MNFLSFACRIKAGDGGIASIVIAYICGLCVICHASPAAPIQDLTSLLQQETDVSQLPYFHNWTSNLQSSYDRTGGNNDFANYLSTNGTTSVMADMDGPGAIVRLWSANPSGTLEIFIDGSLTPVIDQPFASLFDGSSPPFSAPLSGKSSGGFYSYLPIPYAKHCRVVVLNVAAGMYYHVNYLTFSPGTPARSFALPLSPADQAAVYNANTVWSSFGIPISFVKTQEADTQLAPGGTAEIATYVGPGVIDRINLALPGVSDMDLRRLILRAYFDGHGTPDIEAPVADFFGNAFGRKPYKTLLLGCSTDGSFEADFPMPFGISARFTLESGEDAPIQVQWSADVRKTPFLPNREGYFHASWSQEITTLGKPHIWAAVRGCQGRFVGVVQTMANLTSGFGFLEGDDQFRVDGQSWLPSAVPTTVVGPWNGTGTEDCFNCAWYFLGGPVTLPMNALLVWNQPLGEIDCLRWFCNDAPTFQNSLDAQIEHGGANTSPGVYYSSVAYWYSNGPNEQSFTMPPATQLAMPTERPQVSYNASAKS